MKKLVLLLLIAVLASSAVAQDAANDEEADNRRYTVEIIIFSYAQDVATGTEIFAPDKIPTELFEAEQDDRQVTSRRPIRSAEIARLAPGNYSMREIYDRMRRLDVYRPLMHFGWTQRTLPEDETQARLLSSFANPRGGLAGELRIYQSRYLHLEVDLTMDATGTPQPANDYVDSGSVKYRIDENRIIRNGDFRYYDHPKFGVLAKVVRVEEDDNDEDPLFEPELLGDN